MADDAADEVMACPVWKRMLQSSVQTAPTPAKPDYGTVIITSS